MIVKQYLPSTYDRPNRWREKVLNHMALTALEKVAAGSTHVIKLFPPKGCPFCNRICSRYSGSRRRVTAQLESERWHRGGVWEEMASLLQLQLRQ